MRRFSTIIASMLLVVTALAAPPQVKKPANPCAGKAQNPCNPCAKKQAQNPCSAKFITTGKESSIVGYIGDSQCGLQHPMGMGNAKDCTLKCVDGGGHFILADRANKVVYLLDKEAQAKAREFAGQKVKVTGHVSKKNKTIHVTKIEAIS